MYSRYTVYMSVFHNLMQHMNKAPVWFTFPKF